METINWGGTPGPYMINGDCDWDVDTGSGHSRYYIGPEGKPPVAIIIATDWFARDAELGANVRLFCEGPAMMQVLRESLPFLRSGELDTRAGHIEVSRIASKFEAILARIDGEQA
ncbi:hypothetical protein [Novosphingobium sp. SG707]|uniref:hypothetical protein n=1 Tax=Novosphingobium sp. SG707 TaxID=2586996 RepID=UPI001446B93C|nr:hypothetical protein [Novosphingobium sp. SG707]NKI99616.1 hypothetical protein [Novosphingobium sp. SG707]